MSECPHCYKKIESGATRCNHCGGEITSDIQELISQKKYKTLILPPIIIGVGIGIFGFTARNMSFEDSFYTGLIVAVIVFSFAASNKKKK